MGYTKRKLPSIVLKRILNNCDKLKNSINRLGVNNNNRMGINSKVAGLSGGSLRNVDLISDTELELTCRGTFDKSDVVIRIEATVDKNGKAVLTVDRNDLYQT